VVAERTGTPPHSPVKLSGIIPPLADSFHQRPETGLDLRAGLYPGDTVVLTHGEETASAPAAQGGTGKTQIAVAFTHALWSTRAVDALVWVSATSREAIVTGFAQAARTTGAADQTLSAEAAAVRFTGWLAHTRRPWALILDDLVSLADLENLWPAGQAGQVVITTRLPEALFRAAPGWSQSPRNAPPSGPRIAPVGRFSRREVQAYLSSRLTGLTGLPDQRAEALDLGEDLDGLPLALSQAAAVMSVNRLSCREYRSRLAERREHMSAVRVDGVSPAVLATWSLAAECAHELPPGGAAWPALALAAMLDPHGIPGAVLTSPAGCGYVAGRPSAAEAADQTLVHAAMTNLARVGLVSIDPASAIRTVRMHPSVQAAVRAYLPPADFEQAVLAAAEALLQAWPEAGGSQAPPERDWLQSDPAERAQLERAQLERVELERVELERVELEQTLRDCVAALWAADSAAPRLPEGGQHARPDPMAAAGTAGAQAAGPRQGAQAQSHRSMLWQPEAHPVLFRRGLSLETSGLAESAITYWQTMLITSTRLLGTEHANAVTARDRLAAAYESAGRFGDAIAVFSSALADRERNQGPEHPDTLAARGYLAHAYASAGRTAEAVALHEQIVASASRQFGAGHLVTLAARAHLADAYQAAARGKEALTAYQMLMTDSERLLGARHPSALATRESLAAAFLANGQPKEAIEHYKRLVADAEAAAGHDHPDAIAARASLASAYRRGGKPKDAIALYQRVLADRERIAGADHPDAITARASLAFAYRSAGQVREAIAAYERTLADRERVQGPDHADTRSARASLAAAYQQAGRLADAINHYEQALADSERMLGPGDLETLTTRSSLAAAYFADGRVTEVIPLLRRTLADSERYLGPDHPMTRTVRENLEAATRA
jgi:tetratricopeptide (TPR) repeat protein